MHRLQPQASVFTVGGRYQIKDPPIGQGGMGVVYKAYDTVTPRYVALKTIWGAVSPTALALFEKEGSTLARLCHPNIIDIIETGQFEMGGQKLPFFVMPLLPGVSLDYLIKKASQRLTVERTVEIISQACRGLQAAHDQGIIHRDVKPSNIFVMDDDSVKLIDFGVVHLADTSTMTAMKGTLNYLAPELLDHKLPSPLSDIFALGVVCYEALTRRKPFERRTEDETIAAIRNYIPVPVSDINSAANEAITRTVHKCLAKQPWHRFSSVREFGDVLKKALHGAPIEYFDPAKIQPRIERVKRAQSEGDFQLAREILGELEAEGHIDLQISLARMQIDQAIKQKTIRQLLESARTRVEEEEFPLAMQKVQEVLEIDAQNADALHLKTQIERQRNEKQIDGWYRLVQQHIENQLFSQARLGLEEILRINPGEAKALNLLGQIDRQEKEANKIREEKELLYQAALKCYECGEVSTALDKLERLLALSRQSTRTPNPEKEAQYQNLYNQIRSEREAFRNGYSEARRCFEDKNFSRTLALCTEFLQKNPSDPMFQALKLEVEERARQERSAALANVDRQVDAEADLDRKISILREAVETYPNEQHFKEALKLARGRRDLLDSIVNRAKQYEDHAQFNEALSQWDILRNIYPQYPGLEAEIDRLKVKREEQLRNESKVRWVRQIDQYMEAGEFDRAQSAVRDALAEFPDDRELASLEKLATQGAEKQMEAQRYLAEGQRLLAGDVSMEAIAQLRKALELDSRNRTMRGALLAALLERARAQLTTHWRDSQALVQEAMRLDGSNPVARSLFAQVQDRERQALIDACVLEARELQAGGNLEGALSKVREGLARHPRETRLAQLESTLMNRMAAGAREKKQYQPLPEQAVPARNRLSTDPDPSLGRSDEAPAVDAQSVEKARTQHSPATRTPSLAVRMKSLIGGLKSPRWPWWAWGVIVAVPVVLAGALIGHRLIGRPHPPSSPGTALRTNVADVKFFVDGQPVGPTITLSPGKEHVLEASREGYQSSSQKVTPVAGQPIPAVEFTLKPLLPRLQILTDIPHASVAVGDQPAASVENGELDIAQVEAGPQIIRISSGHRQVAEISLSVEPGKPVSLAGPLQTGNSSIAVVSILGAHAKVFASADLKGTAGGQDLQSIPPEGVDVDTSAASASFNLSNGRALPLAPSNQPALIISLSARTGEAVSSTSQFSRLIMSGMPPEAELLIDNDLPRPVGAPLFQISLPAGRHTIVLRRPRFEDSDPVPVNLKPNKPETVSGDRFVQTPQGSMTFKITPESANVTYQLEDPPQAQRRANPGDTVWVKPGKYIVRAEAQNHVGDQWEQEVKAGSASTLSHNLKALAVATPPPPTPTPEKSAVFEDAKLWSRDGNWWVWKDSTFGWLHSRHGTFEVTIQRPKKSFMKSGKVEWTIDNHENDDRVDYYIEGNTLHRVAYKNGKPTPDFKVDMAKHPKDFQLTFEVTAQHIIISEADNGKLDTYERPNSGALGKIGFKGKIEVIVQQK